MVRINIGIGPLIRTFIAHAPLLRSRSSYFKKALSKTWSEGQDREISLDDIDCEIFDLYLNLVYHNQIPAFNYGKIEYTKLAKLYVMSERFLDTGAKNAVTEAIILKSKEVDHPQLPLYPGPEDVKIIYDGTPESRPIRRLLVDIYASYGSLDWVYGKSDAFEKEFLYDVLCRIWKGNVESPYELHKYHEKESNTT